jgi:hypothetical protein
MALTLDAMKFANNILTQVIRHFRTLVKLVYDGSEQRAH